MHTEGDRRRRWAAIESQTTNWFAHFYVANTFNFISHFRAAAVSVDRRTTHTLRMCKQLISANFVPDSGKKPIMIMKKAIKKWRNDWQKKTRTKRVKLHAIDVLIMVDRDFFVHTICSHMRTFNLRYRRAQQRRQLPILYCNWIERFAKCTNLSHRLSSFCSFASIPEQISIFNVWPFDRHNPAGWVSASQVFLCAITKISAQHHCDGVHPARCLHVQNDEWITQIRKRSGRRMGRIMFHRANVIRQYDENELYYSLAPPAKHSTTAHVGKGKPGGGAPRSMMKARRRGLHFAQFHKCKFITCDYFQIHTDSR